MSYRGQDEKEAVFSFLGWAESLGSLPRGKEMFVYYSIYVCIYVCMCLYTTVYVLYTTVCDVYYSMLYTTVCVVYYSICVCILQYVFVYYSMLYTTVCVVYYSIYVCILQYICLYTIVYVCIL